MRQSIQCRRHSVGLHNRFRTRYNGTIPAKITTAVRAGILRGIPGDDPRFLDLVSCLAQKHAYTTGAMEIISEISKFSSIQLKDNTFWNHHPKRTNSSCSSSSKRICRGSEVLTVSFPVGWYQWAPVLWRVRLDPWAIFHLWETCFKTILDLPEDLEGNWIERVNYKTEHCCRSLHFLAECLSMYYSPSGIFFGLYNDTEDGLLLSFVDEIQSPSTNWARWLARKSRVAARFAQYVD